MADAPSHRFAEPEAARAPQPAIPAGPVGAVPESAVPVSGLLVGAAHDTAEILADQAADAAMARLYDGPAARHGAGGHGETRGGPTPIRSRAARRQESGAGGAIGPAGGALDAATDRQLSSRLGRGAALEGTVRRHMEGAFGRSFAQVRVHADEQASHLSRQMSATAFTVGSDVFFGAGAYRPGDEGGQRLIAHELAHVAQSDGGARRQIRRAVGFEFETSVMVKRRDPTTGVFSKLAKGTVIKAYDRFRMEADENTSVGSTIEYVVDPPVNETERKKLVKIMAKIVSVTERIRAADDGTFNWAADFTTWAPTTSLKDAGTGVSDKTFWMLPKKNVEANPQVTGGIDLPRLIDMLSEIGSGDKAGLGPENAKAAGALEGLSPGKPAQYAGAVIAAAPPPGIAAPSKELQGIAAMLVAYLVFADTGSLLNYAKLMSNSIMMRTDFGALFQRIPDRDRDVLIANPAAFMNWILTIAGLAAAPDAPVLNRGVRLSSDKASANYLVRDPHPGMAVTRREWLLGITLGVDRMTLKTNAALALADSSLGKLGSTFDAVGPEAAKKPKNQSKTGAIMEFRNMSKDVHYTDWSPLALRVFDYIGELNNR